jgi:hypothetical protein
MISAFGNAGLLSAVSAFGLAVAPLAEAGVNDDQLRASVHDNRIEDECHFAGFHMRRGKGRIDLVRLGVCHKPFRQREGTGAVGNDGDLDAAYLVAIPAGGLLSGQRGAGTGGCGHRQRHRRSRGRRGGGRQHAAAGEFSHAVLPSVVALALRFCRNIKDLSLSARHLRYAVASVRLDLYSHSAFTGAIAFLRILIPLYLIFGA